ncbi:MAG TPA: hypothetical protein VGF48_10060 [Thermoanaerobaculia bacterium]|jgi:hypothetical protein
MSELVTRELVRGRIAVTDSLRYAVSFSGNGGRPADADLVRFTLHFYARVLYEMVHAHRSVRDLPAKVEELASKPFEFGSAMRIHAMDAPDALEAVLLATGYRRYDLQADFTGRSEAVLKRALLSVIETVLRTATDDLRNVLTTALLNMNVSYGVTHRYADVKSIAEVPAIAYQAAMFV